MSVDKKSPALPDGALPETNYKALDNLTLPDQVRTVNTLKAAFDALQKEAQSLNHGNVALNLFFRDGVISRYTIDRQVSFLCNGE